MSKRRLRRKILASPVVLGGLAYLGWWGLWPVHWTSQGPGEFPAAIARYYAAVAEVAEVAPAASFLHNGHRGGSYEEYATNLQRGVPAAPLSVVELMDQAFARGMNAVEVDVRPSPLDARDVVLVHDRIEGELDPAARAYALENTARRVVERFLAAGRHLEGKRLVLEVKAPRVGLDDSAREAIDRLAATLEELLGPRADEARARAAVDLISFSHAALTRLRAALGPGAAGHGLFQIVTSNRYPEWLFELGTQPPFGAALQGKLREVAWLRGVYFDPQFVDDFAPLFNGINADREAQGLEPLELHVSTYSQDLAGLVACLRAQPEPLRHVRGLIYQLRKDD